MSIIKNGKTYGVETKIVGGSTDTSLKDFLSDNIEVLNIPEGITKLTKYTITYKNNITKVVVPDSVTELDGYLVYYCPNVDDITIGDGVTSIPDSCIGASVKSGYLNKVKNVTLGSNVQTIGKYALNCGKKLTVKATIPPVLQSSSLYYADNLCYILVPYESLDAYKNAEYWSTKSDMILPIHSQDIETVEMHPASKYVSTDGSAHTFSYNAEFDISFTIDGVDYTYPDFVPYSVELTENDTGSIRSIETTVYYRGVGYTVTVEQEPFVNIDYTVEGVEGSDYSFTQDEDGWWVNTNQNVDSSFCYAKVTVNTACSFSVKVNQSSEKAYDYAVISEIDTDLPIDATQTGGLYTTKGVDGYNTYTGWTSTGSSYITIKYCKDSSGKGGTDTFKFKLV